MFDKILKNIRKKNHDYTNHVTKYTNIKPKDIDIFNYDYYKGLSLCLGNACSGKSSFINKAVQNMILPDIGVSKIFLLRSETQSSAYNYDKQVKDARSFEQDFCFNVFPSKHTFDSVQSKPQFDFFWQQFIETLFCSLFGADSIQHYFALIMQATNIVYSKHESPTLVTYYNFFSKLKNVQAEELSYKIMVLLDKHGKYLCCDENIDFNSSCNTFATKIYNNNEDARKNKYINNLLFMSLLGQIYLENIVNDNKKTWLILDDCFFRYANNPLFRLTEGLLRERRKHHPNLSMIIVDDDINRKAVNNNLNIEPMFLNHFNTLFLMSCCCNMSKKIQILVESYNIDANSFINLDKSEILLINRGEGDRSNIGIGKF